MYVERTVHRTSPLGFSSRTNRAPGLCGAIVYPSFPSVPYLCTLYVRRDAITTQTGGLRASCRASDFCPPRGLCVCSTLLQLFFSGEPNSPLPKWERLLFIYFRVVARRLFGGPPKMSPRPVYFSWRRRDSFVAQQVAGPAAEGGWAGATTARCEARSYATGTCGWRRVGI